MKLRKLVLDTARVIADEAERNPDFASRLRSALASANGAQTSAKTEPKPSEAADDSPDRRHKNRRAPAMFDPVQIVADGEAALRERLSTLNLDQLRDVVADHSMDPGKLVAKWKDRERVVNRIVDLSVARLHKGDAFRTQVE